MPQHRSRSPPLLKSQGRADEQQIKKRDRSRSRDKGDITQRTSSRRSNSLDSDRRDKKRRKDKSERKSRKAEKRRAREEEEARVVAELSVYSATDNPFHDTNLGQQFKWHKKNEQDKKRGLSSVEAERRDLLRRQEAKEELERLNKRRAEREIEMKLREEEEARMHRLTESAQMAEWVSKEGEFQLDQERKRAAIRLKEKRAKAVDFLALNLKYASMDREDEDSLDDTGLEIDLDEPYAIFDNLSLEQTEELQDNIEKYLSLEQLDLNINFWTNMMVVCKDQLEKFRSESHKPGVSTDAVKRDIHSILDGKSYEQLSLLQRQIQSKLGSGEPVDVEYWEGLLKELLVWKAKAKLKGVHEVVVRNRLEQLRKRQRDEALQAQQELLATHTKSNKTNWGSEMRADAVSEAPDIVVVEHDTTEIEEYDAQMSPVLMDVKKLSYEDRQLPLVDPQAGLDELYKLRHDVAASSYVPKSIVEEEEIKPIESPVVAPDVLSEALYKAEAEKDFDEEEEAFNLEEDIQNRTTYNWEDKYRPRKPRYFNRVHTGYEWNKYNQTHYDTDNPPPKVVQGYKFNIFYPDLIDKSKAPTYKIVKEPGNEDTVLLHFTAGPPYEDVAFRIVNRDWEYSHKRGFRSSFDRGCLSLWFNFRRNFYRK